jgi:translation initiation factor IF-1
VLEAPCTSTPGPSPSVIHGITELNPTGERLSEKEAGIEVQGRVEESSGGMYRVKLDQGPIVLAYPSGKMKRFHIRIITGDRVKVELSPYDLARGRITYRDK